MNALLKWKPWKIAGLISILTKYFRILLLGNKRRVLLKIL